MPFSKEEILGEFVEAQRLGLKPLHENVFDAEAERREYVLARARERAKQWRADPRNRERKRQQMKLYNAEPETRRRQAERRKDPNVTEKLRAYMKAEHAKAVRRKRRAKPTRVGSA